MPPESGQRRLLALAVHVAPAAGKGLEIGSGLLAGARRQCSLTISQRQLFLKHSLLHFLYRKTAPCHIELSLDEARLKAPTESGRSPPRAANREGSEAGVE
jgi:hypothetical protein